MTKKTASFKAALAFPSSGLAVLFSRIEQQKRVLRTIQSVLPDSLVNQVLHCVVSDKKLLIYTGSAVWASQIRFYDKIILASIAPVTTHTISMMQVKVLLENSSNTELTVRKTHIPSTETIDIIRNQGLSASDNQLKLALLKLSATLKRLAS